MTTFVGLPNAALEVEPDPARAEVDRLADDLPVDHGSRNADGDANVLPVGRLLEDARDHLLGRELVAGREPAPLVEAVQHLLDVGAADVDREHGGSAGLHRVPALLLLAHDPDPAAAASAMTSAFAVEIQRGGDRLIALAQPPQRVDLVLARHEPEDLPRAVQRGVRQCHPLRPW